MSDTYSPADLARNGFCPCCEAAPYRLRERPGGIDPDGTMSVVVWCTQCGSEWSQVYRFDRIEILKPGRPRRS